MKENFIKKLKELQINYKENEVLAPYTTLNIGGPAEIFVECHDNNQFIEIIKAAQENSIDITLLGGGSNVLISDAGIKGVVIRLCTENIEILSKENGIGKKKVDVSKIPDLTARWESDKKKGTFKVEFSDLDYDETDLYRVDVLIDAGVNLAKAREYLFSEGITGLQWYAGIPGTVGGAVFNNIHGGTHFISEVLKEVKVIDTEGHINVLRIDELGVDYDKSRFHHSGEIILQATFSLFKGDVERARQVAYEWARRKREVQPYNSPGCTYANITQEQKVEKDYPTTSVGYIVEHILNLTDFRVGGAKVSAKHHNFIENAGDATAADFLAVMKEIYRRTKEITGITLVPEIILLGFEPDEIKEFTQEEQEDLRKIRNKEIKTVYKKKNNSL